MQIGVFDSGRGGELVAERLRKLLPYHTFVTAGDTDHVPYGSRPQDEILALTDTAIQPLLHCPIIVIACNTATAAGIAELRTRYPGTQFVGLEPMVKPAAAMSDHITVLATPFTLVSQQYRRLVAQFANNTTIDTPDVAHWATQIEHNQLHELNYDAVDVSVRSGSTVIVLACTHYLACQDVLQRRYPTVTLLEPTRAIGQQIERLVLSRTSSDPDDLVVVPGMDVN